MKALGKIGIQLCIVLLALSNVASQRCIAMAQQPNEVYLKASAFYAYSNPLLCQSKQNTGFALKEVGSSLPKKLLALAWGAYSLATNSHSDSFSHYFSASKYLLTALEVSDIIFPFHHFW